MKNICVLLSSENSSEFFECYCIHVDHAIQVAKQQCLFVMPCLTNC